MNRGYFKTLVFSNKLFLLALIFLSGCQKTISPPALNGAPVDRYRLNEIINELDKLNSSINSFRILYRTKLTSGSEKALLRHAVVSNRPDFLRIDVLPVNGVYSLGMLVSNPKEALYLNPQDKTAVVGTNSPNLLRKTLKMPLELHEVQAYLIGIIPNSIIERLKNSEFRVLRGDTLATITDQDEKRFWQFDSENFLLKRVHFRNVFDNTFELDMIFLDYQEHGTELLPTKLILNTPDYSLEMSLQKASINGEFSTDLFSIDLPASYRIRTLNE